MVPYIIFGVDLKSIMINNPIGQILQKTLWGNTLTLIYETTRPLVEIFLGRWSTRYVFLCQSGILDVQFTTPGQFYQRPLIEMEHIFFLRNYNFYWTQIKLHELSLDGLLLNSHFFVSPLQDKFNIQWEKYFCSS